MGRRPLANKIMNKNNLSRRDLMKVGALGLGGALFAPARRAKALPVTLGDPSDETHYHRRPNA